MLVVYIIIQGSMVATRTRHELIYWSRKGSSIILERRKSLDIFAGIETIDNLQYIYFLEQSEKDTEFWKHE